MCNRPILIVGAGPVGLSLATALIRRGLDVIIFEADADLNDEIRASTFHPATLEMFAEWGVIDTVLASGHIVERLQYWERVTKTLLAEFSYSLITADTPFPFRLQCPQHVLTRVLEPVVASAECGTVQMAHRFVSYDDCGDHVVAHFATPEGMRSVAGSYLCGADGAGSTVRKALGLSFDGMTYEDRFLLIGTDIDFTRIFPQAGPVMYIFDPQEWVIILNLPDVVRVVFRLTEEESAEIEMQPAAVRSRLRRLIGDMPFTIKMTSVYRVHQRVAESFRVGRVMLLGDAAHINNPSGGMGMNSGIHDAYSLAEKLAAVLAGGDDTLLDAYSAERRRVALDLVQAYTDRSYRDLASAETGYRQRRNDTYRQMAADPATARAFLLRASMLAHRI
ncbi:MAG: FAD-dependent monooxygenase [Anaerolineae bacterium]|nr:FAD-dependent monooxygenase [Anaerolineae bacterium]